MGQRQISRPGNEGSILSRDWRIKKGVYNGMRAPRSTVKMAARLSRIMNKKF